MIAANSNTVFNAMSYQADCKLVAYAASNTVLILDPYTKTTYTSDGDVKVIPTPKVICSLNHHTTRVNAVSWISANILASIGGDEKSIVIWEAREPKQPATW